MVDEPVRGGFPDASFYSLPGIDQARAQLRGLVPRSPLSHLVGCRLTQVSSGSATLTMPASPWLQHADGTIEVRIVAAEALAMAALTAAPPSTEVTTATLSVNYLRAPSIQDETYVARARVVHSVRTFTLAEVLVEDALGRAVLHATGSLLMSAIDAPGHSGVPKEVLEEPAYTTPDPHQRPHPGGFPWTLLDELGGLAVLRMNAEVSGADVAGIAVHIASRVQGLAASGEILVSGTVHDLVTGSGVRFTDRGRHQLKGVEGDWPIFALTD